MKKTYYQILGVRRNATPSEIKSAYRNLALKCHPDRNPNDKNAVQEFQLLNEANEVLSDADARKKYDQSLGLEDEESCFSRSKRKRDKVPVKGPDLFTLITITLIQAAEGLIQELFPEGRRIRIQVPPGVEESNTLVYAGCGGEGEYGGAYGNLHVKFTILPDSRWTRIHTDLYTTVQVELYVMVLGGDVSIETLDGSVTMKVDPGTFNGTIKRLKGKGFPALKNEGKRGHLFVTLVIKTPRNLSAKEKQLFEELAQISQSSETST